MGGSGEYEPKDSRNVTGEAHTPDGRWSNDKQDRQQGGEYEPRDSRNVTGTASTPDGRWTNTGAQPPAGVPDDNPSDADDATVLAKKDRPSSSGAQPPAQKP